MTCVVATAPSVGTHFQRDVIGGGHRHCAHDLVFVVLVREDLRARTKRQDGKS